MNSTNMRVRLRHFGTEDIRVLPNYNEEMSDTFESLVKDPARLAVARPRRGGATRDTAHLRYPAILCAYARIREHLTSIEELCLTKAFQYAKPTPPSLCWICLRNIPIELTLPTEAMDVVVSEDLCLLSTDSIVTIWEIASCLVRKTTLNPSNVISRAAAISSHQQVASSAGAFSLQGMSRSTNVSKYLTVTKPVTDVFPCRCV
ncbi:hypothetical protein J6590_069176 [Homalodisca vitripennis]|nr:hypothetical protein J6590_069176 [Homalodisca vitripennis]